MSHQSYRDVFVVNNPALYKSGYSEFLAAGQLGIFEYNPKKDFKAVANPTYAIHKIIQLVQGTPETSSHNFAAVANVSKKSKSIKGKKILEWSGRRAERGQNQRIALGYDGVNTAKTISARCEETKSIWLRLWGGPIDQIFHTEGKGFVQQYNIFSGCCDDCGADCATVNAEAMADDLVKQVMNDPILGLGTRTGNKVITAKKIVNTALAASDDVCFEWLLNICDNGDDTSLGYVQSKYPTASGLIYRKSRAGSTSTYSMLLDNNDAAPGTFSNEGLVLINDCAVCPSGYSSPSGSTAGFAYRVNRSDAGSAGNLTTLKSDYGIVAPESGNRLLYQFGQSTYVIVSTTALAAPVGTDVLEFLGKTGNTCILTTPTTKTWDRGINQAKYYKTFEISLNDNVCGISRLTELQAFYPNSVIVEASAGACVRRFTTIVASNCVPVGCPPDVPEWITPDPYQGISWKAVAAAAGTATSVGVIFENNFIDRITGECAYPNWSYDAEPIFIEINQHSQDYNDKPTICATEWPVTEIQAAKLPIGVGSRVREEEAFHKGYERKYWDDSQIVREQNGSTYQADPKLFYDQYTIKFEFDYNQGWFSEKETDTYQVEVYFPEGNGGDFEAVINAYVASLSIDLSPVVLTKQS